MTKIALVDAFTRRAGVGNRAGVVVDEQPRDDATLIGIAAAVAASETAFLGAATAGRDVHLRYFTPTVEIPFCGHATLASFHYLAEIGRLDVPGRYSLHYPGGVCAVELEADDDAPCRVWIATPQPEWTDCRLDDETLFGLIGGTPAMRDRELPVRCSGTKAFVPVATRDALWSLSPRYRELARQGEAANITAVYVFTRDAAEPGSVTQGRMFAPASGIQEDPVTGSASGPLGLYLARHGVIALPATGGTTVARVEQGDAMGRPGRVDIEVTGAPGNIERVRIGGVAVTVLDGTLGDRAVTRR